MTYSENIGRINAIMKGFDVSQEEADRLLRLGISHRLKQFITIISNDNHWFRFINYCQTGKFNDAS